MIARLSKASALLCATALAGISFIFGTTTQAWAADPAIYKSESNHLYIDGRSSQPSGSPSTFGSARGNFPAGGSWDWDFDNRTLTLDNADMRQGQDVATFGIFIWTLPDDENVKIVFKGKNYIYSNRGGGIPNAFNLVSPKATFELIGEGSDAELNIIAESNGVNGEDPSALSITSPGGVDTRPSLVFKSGTFNLSSTILPSDTKSTQVSAIYGAAERLEFAPDAQVTLQAKSANNEAQFGYSLRLLSGTQIVFNNTKPVLLEADAGKHPKGAQPGLLVRERQGKNAEWSFSGDGEVIVRDTGAGRVLYGSSLEEGMKKSATEDHEIGFVEPYQTIVHRNYPLYFTDPQGGHFVSGASDVNTVKIGKIYTIDSALVDEEGTELTLTDADDKPIGVNLSNDGLPIVQSRNYEGKALPSLAAGANLKMSAPAFLKDGELVFKAWEDPDGLLNEEQKSQADVTITMPEKRITLHAVYEQVRSAPLNVIVSGSEDDADKIAALKPELLGDDGQNFALSYDETDRSWKTDDELKSGAYKLSFANIPEGYTLSIDDSIADNIATSLEDQTDPASNTFAVNVTKDDLLDKESFTAAFTLTAPKPEPAPEPKPDPEPAPQPEPKPEPKPEPEPAPQPEPKPQPEPVVRDPQDTTLIDSDDIDSTIPEDKKVQLPKDRKALHLPSTGQPSSYNAGLVLLGAGSIALALFYVKRRI